MPVVLVAFKADHPDSPLMWEVIGVAVFVVVVGLIILGIFSFFLAGRKYFLRGRMHIYIFRKLLRGVVELALGCGLATLGLKAVQVEYAWYVSFVAGAAILSSVLFVAWPFREEIVLCWAKAYIVSILEMSSTY
jgi:hypothetical protein